MQTSRGQPGNVLCLSMLYALHKIRRSSTFTSREDFDATIYCCGLTSKGIVSRL